MGAEGGVGGFQRLGVVIGLQQRERGEVILPFLADAKSRG